MFSEVSLINDYIRLNSGFERHRPYLGMSCIADCPRRLYHQFFNGQPMPGQLQHQKAYQGYFYERELKHILAATGLYIPGSERELVASFDDRFKGHTEGEDRHGRLVEVKSIQAIGYNELLDRGRVKLRHYWQLQAYMQHGGYKTAVVYLVNTERFEIRALQVNANPAIQGRIDQRALEVLHAIDAERPPACACGRCN